MARVYSSLAGVCMVGTASLFGGKRMKRKRTEQRDGSPNAFLDGISWKCNRFSSRNQSQPQAWESHTAIVLAYLLSSQQTPIILDLGTKERANSFCKSLRGGRLGILTSRYGSLRVKRLSPRCVLCGRKHRKPFSRRQWITLSTQRTFASKSVYREPSRSNGSQSE